MAWGRAGSKKREEGEHASEPVGDSEGWELPEEDPEPPRPIKFGPPPRVVVAVVVAVRVVVAHELAKNKKGKTKAS